MNDMTRASETKNLTSLMFQAMVFVNVIIVNVFFTMGGSADAESNSISLDSVIRFLVSGTLFGLGMLSFRRWGGVFFRADNVILIPLLLLIGASCFYSPSFVYSMRSALTLLFVIGFYFAANEVLGPRILLRTIIYAIGFICFGSICAYFVVPEIGRGSEWDEMNMKVEGTRMSGITGAPNFMGFIAAIGVALAFFYRGINNGKWGYSIIAASVISLAALFMSDSRGSLLALVCGVGLAQLTRPSLPRVIILLSICVTAAAIYFWVDINAVLSNFSRSGNAGDVATGRTEIWAVAKDLIAQKPFWGWGYASPAKLLPAFQGQVGFLTTHCHNMYYQILTSLGGIGFFIFFALLAAKYITAFYKHDSFKMALVYMILLHGMVEPSVLQGVANMDTIVFVLILAISYPQRQKLNSHSFFK